jgi:hypothetical protein
VTGSSVKEFHPDLSSIPNLEICSCVFCRCKTRFAAAIVDELDR